MRVPYRGLDQWTRHRDPARRHGAGRARGAARVLAAARPASASRSPRWCCWSTLYAVPAVALDFAGEFLRGALLALLVLAFLRLEKLRTADAPAAAALAALAPRRSALIVAPALDARHAVVGLRDVGARRPPASKSTTFSWDHNYGPLNWPRDGRELLRVKAKQPAYWKAENLDVFDGQRWRATRSRHDARRRLPSSPADPPCAQRWTPGDPGQRAQPAHADVRHRGLRRRRADMPQPRQRFPTASPGISAVEPHAAPRRHLHG